MTGCQKVPVSEPSYTIQGEAQGKNGLIKVELFVEKDQLTHIEVLEHSETPGFDKKMIQIIDEILTTQSMDIDIISGATETSEGILAAIQNALDHSDKTILHSSNNHTTDKNVDILIIGGGGAGFAAAIEAKTLGFENVKVIEKMPFGGGNTRMSGGEFACANNYLQKAQNIQDSKELFFQDVYEGGGKLGNPELIRLITDSANDNLMWLINEIGVEYKDTLSWYGGHSVARTLWPKGDGSKYIDLLIQKALDLGVSVDYNTRAYALLQDENGKVIGVDATYNNETVRYYAQHGVILSTGGFSANIDMRMHYDTQWNKLDDKIPTTNSPAASGDGIEMAKNIGANLVGMEYIQLYPINNPATGNYYYMDYARIISNAILVNEEGKRFVDEKETRDNIALATINQTNSTAYELISQSVIEELGLNDEYADELYRGIDQGVIVMGTLEECAAHFNLDAQTLRSTIIHYNQMARNGKDLDFNRTQQLTPLDDGPYLMFSSVVSVHYTMGGVEINKNAEVINLQGEVIEGLYAAGEVTGGIHGNNRLGTLSIPDTVTFGRIAARSCFEKNH